VTKGIKHEALKILWLLATTPENYAGGDGRHWYDRGSCKL